MNIIKTETSFIAEATTTGKNDKKNRNVTYHFIESADTVCLVKEKLIQAQGMAPQRLLRPVRVRLA